MVSRQLRRFCAALLVAAISGEMLGVPAQAAATSYSDTVLSTGPSRYFQLNEASGTSAADASGNNSTASYSGTPTFGKSSAMPSSNDTSTGFGDPTYTYLDATTAKPTNTMSEQVWFRTTTTTGGDLMALRSDAYNVDRVISLINSGQISFRVYSNYANKSVTSPKSYNDGSWHLVTATLGTDGLRLYVDAQLVSSDASVTTAQEFGGSNFTWRLGGDNAADLGEAGPQDRKNARMDLDEAVLWQGKMLSASEVGAMYSAAFGGNASMTLTADIKPTLSFSVSAHSGACNGETQSSGIGASTSNVSFGALTIGAPTTAAQHLTIATNAGSGYSVYARNTGPFAAGSSSLPDVSGTNLTPGTFPGGAAFGYTTSDSSLSAIGAGVNRFTGSASHWAAMTTSNAEVLYGPAPTATEEACVAYRVSASATTPAGNYSTVVVYTAVPSF